MSRREGCLQLHRLVHRKKILQMTVTGYKAALSAAPCQWHTETDRYQRECLSPGSVKSAPTHRGAGCRTSQQAAWISDNRQHSVGGCDTAWATGGQNEPAFDKVGSDFDCSEVPLRGFEPHSDLTQLDGTSDSGISETTELHLYKDSIDVIRSN